MQNRDIRTTLDGLLRTSARISGMLPASNPFRGGACSDATGGADRQRESLLLRITSIL